MKRTTFIVLAWMLSVSMAVCLAQDEAFLKRVESRVRRIANGEEGLANPEERERLKEAMSEGGDWDGALLRLADLSKYDDQVAGTAIGVLQLRGSFGRPEVQAAVVAYFKARVNAARTHDRSDPRFDPVVMVSGLTSSFAKKGSPDLLLNLLDYANSAEERADPLLDQYALNAIAEALLEKADSRHLEGMRKLLAASKDVAVRERLERAIAMVVSEIETPRPDVAPKILNPQRSAPLTFRQITPLASVPARNVANAFSVPTEHRAPIWPWATGILAAIVIFGVALGCRKRGQSK